MHVIDALAAVDSIFLVHVLFDPLAINGKRFIIATVS